MGNWFKDLGKGVKKGLGSTGFLGADFLGLGGGGTLGGAVGGEYGANPFDLLDLSGSTAKKYQSAEADKERTWQTQMSNTAHQREVADLKAAGLNPVLSAGGSGATSSSGAAASGVESNGAEKIAAILGAMTNIKNAKTSAKQVESEAKLNTEQEKNVQNQIINRNIETAQHVAESQARINHLNEQAKSEAIDNHINEMLGISKQETGQTRQAAWVYHNAKEKEEIKRDIKNATNKEMLNNLNKQNKAAQTAFDKKVLSKLSKKETMEYVHGDKNTKYKLARIAKQRGAFE